MAAENDRELALTLEKLKAKWRLLTLKMEEDEQHLKIIQAKYDGVQGAMSKAMKRRALRMTAKKEYEKTIMETEAAYTKIVDSSVTLLHALKQQTAEDDEDMDAYLEGKEMPGGVRGADDAKPAGDAPAEV